MTNRRPIRAQRVARTHGTTVEDGHEAATHKVVATRLAALLDLPYAGACEDGQPFASSYVVPRTSLSGRGIAGADHALSDPESCRSYDQLLSSWLREMIFGAR